MEKNIYIIHENDEWLIPLRESFKKIKAPYKEWHMNKVNIDLKGPAPSGVFYNRMSASSHSRGHRYAPEKTRDLLKWLERDKKRVINNSRALELEISKIEQYKELEKFNIKFPKTLSTKNKNELIERSKEFNKPFITKHNRGGRGLGVKTSEEALSYLCKAIEKAGYKLEEDIVFALDIAASELYKDGQYFLSNDNASSSEDLIDMWEELTNKYPIFSIEDPLHEDDWSGWINLNERIGKKTQIVGDDLFVTNPERLKMGIEKNAANSILIKVNQIGTITETLETIDIAKNNKYSCVISHRSGETEDTFIADLSVATNSGQIKTGSMTRSDRVAKYNQLIRIESNLQNNSSYAGKSILKKN